MCDVASLTPNAELGVGKVCVVSESRNTREQNSRFMCAGRCPDSHASRVDARLAAEILCLPGCVAGALLRSLEPTPHAWETAGHTEIQPMRPSAVVARRSKGSSGARSEQHPPDDRPRPKNPSLGRRIEEKTDERSRGRPFHEAISAPPATRYTERGEGAYILRM